MRIQIGCLAIVLLIQFSACGNQAALPPDDRYQYASFRDIPGITGDEINAVEALQKEYASFIYAMPLSVEAFESANGEVRGFTASFCEWLTNLFGIPFQPRLYEWLDLLAGLETLEISFSGELTATPERMKSIT